MSDQTPYGFADPTADVALSCCGNQLWDAANFCPLCGKAVGQSAAPQVGEAVPPYDWQRIVENWEQRIEELNRELAHEMDIRRTREAELLEARTTAGVQAADTQKELMAQLARSRMLEDQKSATEGDLAEQKRISAELERRVEKLEFHLKRALAGRSRWLWPALAGAVGGALLATAAARFVRTDGESETITLGSAWKKLDIPAGAHVSLRGDGAFRLRSGGEIYSVPVGQSVRLPASKAIEARAADGSVDVAVQVEKKE